MNIDLPLMLIVALFIGVAILSQWVASLLKWPAIVVMSIIGLLIGPILGIVNPEAAMGSEIYDTIVSLSVAIILFEGSSNLDARELLGVSKAARRIITAGTFIGWLLGTAALYYIIDFPLPVALVLSGLFIVTGPTVIQPLLEQAKVKRSVDSILRWESIILDPVGPMVALLIFYIYQVSLETIDSPLVFEYVVGLALAVVIGFGAAFIFKWMVKKDLIAQNLMAPIQFIFVIITFSICDAILHESGLLAVTIFGLSMAKSKKEDLIFHESNQFVEQLTMICVSTVFILITSSLTMEMLNFVFSWEVLLFCLAMIIIARPLSVFLSTIGTEISLKEKSFLSVAAPRGIVALTVAGFFTEQFSNLDVPMVELILPVTFGFSFITVVIYGFGFKPLSKAIGVSSKEPPGIILLGETQFSLKLAERLKSHGIPVMISDELRDHKGNSDDGIERFKGTLLSERDRMYADLIRFDKCLIVTKSPVFNLLAFTMMVNEFGIKNVMLLSSDNKDANNQIGPAMHKHVLFNGRLSYSLLNEYVEKNHLIEIPATERHQLEELDMVIYHIDEDKNVVFKNMEQALNSDDEGILGVLKQR